MKVSKTKKMVSIFAMSGLLACGTALCPPPAIAANNSLSVNVSVNQSQSGIDWTKGDASNITAVGVGLPKGQGMALARVAAIMDAQRNLLGIIKGVQIDADTLMQDLVIANDTVKRNISGLLRGAQVVEEGANPDGSYFVRMTVPLYGATDSVAAAVLPEVLDTGEPEPFPEVEVTELPEPEQTELRSADYSGVVVDADNMGLSPTFSPVIYDTNGRAVYGAKNIDADIAIRQGMVGYADDLPSAETNTRVGSNPLVVKAVEVKGGASPASKVNVVISVEDADRILLANQTSNMLQKSSVVFVK